MSVVGLDFGSLNTVIAAAGRGGVDVVLNGNSNRLNPNMVGFDQSRVMGEVASSTATSNYKNTIKNMKRLIGLTFDDPRAQAEMEGLAFKCVPIQRAGYKSIGVEVRSNDEDKVIPIEAVAGMMVKHMGGIVAQKTSESSNNMSSKVPTTSVSHPLYPQDWVVAVPGYYTDAQKRAFLTGCEVAGIKGILRLIHETTATALAYGIFKDIRKEFTTENPTNIMFLDIGATAFSVSIVTFEPGKLIVKSTQYDTDLGGRDFDLVIAQWLADSFEEKYKNKLGGKKPMDQPKVRIKLLIAAEKAKKTLSPAGVREARINLECLMNDLDFNIKLEAPKFEKMVQPLLDRLIAPLQRALDEAKLTPDQLSSVEIVGGATRVSCLKRTLSTYLKLDMNATNYGLSTTMNADEAVARGAALQSAILSPRFRVAPYEITEYQPYPVLISWDGDDHTPAESGEGESSGVNSVIMFDRASSFPLVRRVTLKRQGEFQVIASYDQVAEEYGLLLHSSVPSNIAAFKIKAPTGCENKVRVNIKQDIHGIITLSSVQMVEEIDEEETPATPASDEKQEETPKEDAKKEEPEKKKKIKKTNLDYVIVRPMEWTKAEFDAAYEAEVEMENHDRVVKETSDMRNELESYIYGMRDKIISASHLAPYCTDDEKTSFSENLGKTENWLYEDGFDAVKSVYAQKLQELKTYGDPVQSRFFQAQHRPNAISVLQRSIEKYKNWLNSAANEEKYAHITDDEKLKCHGKCDEISSWMYEMLDKQGVAPTYAEPAVTIAQIQEKNKEISDVVNPIMMKPAPKPKPVPPAEEKKKEESNAEGPMETDDTSEKKSEPMETDNASEKMDTTS